MHHLFFFILAGGSFVFSAPTPTPTNRTTMPYSDDDVDSGWHGILAAIGILIIVVIVLLLSPGFRTDVWSVVHTPFNSTATFVSKCLRACKQYHPFKIAVEIFPNTCQAIIDWLTSANMAEDRPVDLPGNDTLVPLERPPVRPPTVSARAAPSGPLARHQLSLPPIPEAEGDITDEMMHGHGLGVIGLMSEAAVGPPEEAIVHTGASSTSVLRPHGNGPIRRSSTPLIPLPTAQPLNGATLAVTFSRSS